MPTLQQYGIPPLSLPTLPVAPAPLTQDTAQVPPPAANWGIFLNNVVALAADSALSIDIRKEWKIGDYPQEKGAFQSYNKVEMPFDARVQLTKGGNDNDRATFLATLDAIAADLNQYDIVTPEKTYLSASILHWHLVRTAQKGVGLLTVEIWLKEIRVTAQQNYSSTVTAPAQPSGSPPQTVGTVQPQTPTPTAAQKWSTLKTKIQNSAPSGSYFGGASGSWNPGASGSW